MKEENDKNDLHQEPEDVEIEDIEEATADKLKQLKKKLKVCDEEKRTALEELQRTRADFLNSKRRLAEQLEKDKERITIAHLSELLPLADSFDMAMQDPSWESCDEKWRNGIEAVHGQLLSILKAHDVSVIDEIGAPFNPNEHDAVSNEEVDDESKADTVTDILQKGYKAGETVIRPAKVSVGVIK